MDFRKATDDLFERIGHEDLAQALGVSVASIRQARLRQDAGAHRAPPQNWEIAVVRLAKRRMALYRDLIDALGKRRTADKAMTKALPGPLA
jgi:hypothetical protein